MAFADFYALVPGEVATITVEPGENVPFSEDGPNSGTGITRAGEDSFVLEEPGTYQVLFQVPVNEAGQLVLTLNGTDLAYTVSGRAADASQIVGMALVTTTEADSVLTVQNPAENPALLTLTPFLGGDRPISAHLVIVRLS